MLLGSGYYDTQLKLFYTEEGTNKPGQKGSHSLYCGSKFREGHTFNNPLACQRSDFMSPFHGRQTLDSFQGVVRSEDLCALAEEAFSERKCTNTSISIAESTY
ncbi:hypothetical protein NDU88_001565 [Pleurodeles waltl]|uniref:Uncharacterized protein n=1 Tax=Pleurodeles waltl TaxID=8319 RepID=A0AAV7T0M4_PLEWA|nr:hypothetical protein NDU88_001565 [Pleurodeles waltl]